MHLDLTIPAAVAAGIARDLDLMVEKIPLVGGGDVRNQEWENPLRSYEVPFPNMKADDPDFIAVLDLWKALDGNTHTFNYFDELDGETVIVRFEGKLRTSHVVGPYWQIDTLLLVEQRER